MRIIIYTKREHGKQKVLNTICISKVSLERPFPYVVTKASISLATAYAT